MVKEVRTLNKSSLCIKIEAISISISEDSGFHSLILLLNYWPQSLILFMIFLSVPRFALLRFCENNRFRSVFCRRIADLDLWFCTIISISALIFHSKILSFFVSYSPHCVFSSSKFPGLRSKRLQRSLLAVAIIGHISLLEITIHRVWSLTS